MQAARKTNWEFVQSSENGSVGEGQERKSEGKIPVKAFIEKEKKHFRREDGWRENAVFTGLLRIGHILKKEKRRGCKRKKERKKKSKWLLKGEKIEGLTDENSWANLGV